MLKEIRKQPEHIRALFMWLSVFIVFSAIAFIWFNSFQNRMRAFLNSKEKELTKEESPFGIIKKSFNDFKADIIDLFSSSKTIKEIKEKENFQEIIPLRLLPLSGEKEKKEK